MKIAFIAMRRRLVALAAFAFLTPLAACVEPEPAASQHTWSPDGSRIAFVRGKSRNDIYVVNADGSGQARLAAGENPAWSPDGERITFEQKSFSGYTSGYTYIYVMNYDGSGLTVLANGYDPAWSPDGNRIAFSRGGEIYVMNADGSQEKRLTKVR